MITADTVPVTFSGVLLCTFATWVSSTQRAPITLSGPGFLPWLCCQVPGVLLFGLLGGLIVCAFESKAAYYVTTAGFTMYIMAWTTNMAIFSAVGAFRMRAAALIDWHERLQAVQEAAKPPGSCDNIMHIVILPNYKEDEDMLEETLLHIAASPLATTCIRIVLGMEAREGEAGSEKAERLIEKTKHLFADVFATFHPVGRPGEVAGKSSNTQWAYKEMLTHYASDLARCDPTRVFISVGDADTLWHPQYFDALAYQALEMTPEEAAWTIWQPPMLLFRNLFAVPGVTRLGGLGTLLFELAGLTNQWLSPHMCFSSYSLTLILANHRFVAGWDADVVAEDHHMFCKCFFACLWEELDGDREKLPLKPKLKLSAIYLPAQGYLVESSEGYFQSCWARFQQARRHSQGVAELGYVLLQYIKLLLSAGPFRLSLSAHYKICAIMWKMFTVHIVNSVQ
ncbi:unnamed protein product, partial [Polarella glacialis]